MDPHKKEILKTVGLYLLCGVGFIAFMGFFRGDIPEFIQNNPDAPTWIVLVSWWLATIIVGSILGIIMALMHVVIKAVLAFVENIGKD